MPTFKFSVHTRDGLRELFPPAVVTELEAVAADYVARASRRTKASASAGARARRDVKRISTAAQRLLLAIEASHPRVRFNVRRTLPTLARDLEALAKASARAAHRPRDAVRFQLECAVGQVLHRHGIELTWGQRGKLGLALQLVLGDVAGVPLEDPRPNCQRVCERVRTEADAHVALDRWVRGGTK